MRLQFGAFHLDTDRAELRTATGIVPLEPKAYRLLCLLVSNTDRVVSKEEMIAVVWDGRFISDAAVARSWEWCARHWAMMARGNATSAPSGASGTAL
jgi:DNA-binding winged helix-turn-helix (wHTH) protein